MQRYKYFILLFVIMAHCLCLSKYGRKPEIGVTNLIPETIIARADIWHNDMGNYGLRNYSPTGIYKNVGEVIRDAQETEVKQK
jgi:hypothetical protein